MNESNYDSDDASSKSSELELEEVDIENHYSTISKNLLKQTHEESFCDVYLQVDDQTFPAHRNVLAASSDYFYKMFTTEMKEKNDKVIPIHDITSDAFKILLDAIYTGKLMLSENNLADILTAASLTQVTMVLETAQDYMDNVVNETNSQLFYNLTNLYSFHDVHKRIVQFILLNFEAVSRRSDFLQMTNEDLSQFLKSDYLTIKQEKYVYEFLIKWMNYNVNERLEHFPLLFKFVRLQYIPIKYVVNNIQSNDFVCKFNECRDLVCNVISYYFTPSVLASQKPRKCFISRPNSILFLGSRNSKHCFYNINSEDIIKEVTFNGLTESTVLPNCAVAINYPYVYLCGGFCEEDKTSKQAVRFDGFRWIQMPPMNEARCGAAAVIFNETLFVFGGEKVPISETSEFSNNQINPEAFNFVQNYESFNVEWKLHSSFPRSLSHARAEVANGKIYIIGGYTLAGNNDPNGRQRCKVATSQTLIFSPADGCLVESNNMQTCRAKFSSAVKNNRIFVIGGCNHRNTGGFFRTADKIEYLSTGENVWTSLCLPFPLKSGFNFIFIKHLIVLNDNKIYFFKDNEWSSKQLNSYIYSSKILVPYFNKLYFYPVY